MQIEFIPNFVLYNYSCENNFCAFSTQENIFTTKKIITAHVFAEKHQEHQDMESSRMRINQLESMCSQAANYFHKQTSLHSKRYKLRTETKRQLGDKQK